MNVVILSCGAGIPEVVSEYGHSSEWIPKAINNTNIKTKIISKHIDKKVISKVGSEKYLLNNFYLKSFKK